MPEVHNRLRQYIVDNNLQPGDRLPSESLLAETMGVGRPLIREALRGLETVGLIETRKGVGRFVRAFDVESYIGHFTSEVLVHSFSANDLAEARCLLEIAAVCTAVEQLSDADCAQIAAFIDTMRVNAARGIRDTDSDIGLHRVIMNRADNRIIAALLDAVYTLGTVLEASQSQSMREQDLLEHERIAQAAYERNGAKAREALIAHFETTASRMGFRPLWRNLNGKEKIRQSSAAN
ncbi:MAG: FadR/GntR family transcriptional regulator [Thermomicrobiales bacterium]